MTNHIVHTYIPKLTTIIFLDAVTDLIADMGKHTLFFECCNIGNIYSPSRIICSQTIDRYFYDINITICETHSAHFKLDIDNSFITKEFRNKITDDLFMFVSSNDKINTLENKLRTLKENKNNAIVVIAIDTSLVFKNIKRKEEIYRNINDIYNKYLFNISFILTKIPKNDYLHMIVANNYEEIHRLYMFYIYDDVPANLSIDITHMIENIYDIIKLAKKYDLKCTLFDTNPDIYATHFLSYILYLLHFNMTDLHIFKNLQLSHLIQLMRELHGRSRYHHEAYIEFLKSEACDMLGI